MIKIDCDGRDFLINEQEILAVIPEANNEYRISLKFGGDNLRISAKEFNQLCKKTEAK